MNLKHKIIASSKQLFEVIQLIKETKIFSLDTEFTRQTTYYPILSTIQIAVKNSKKEQELFLIDCLKKIDLSDFFAIIADEKIVKIMHSCAQDLQIFNHQSNLLPQSVVDTQIMANFCGFNFSVGYSNLVEAFFQKSLNKQQQRSNWQLRPLTQEQIEYALLDVVFLEEIHEKLLEVLHKKSRHNWLCQEMQNFTDKILNKSDESLTKNFSFRGKSSKQIFQIKSLISCRENWARKINVPRQHLIKDEAIENLVLNREINLNLNHELKAEIKKILKKKSEDFAQNDFFEKESEMQNLMTANQKNCYLEAKKLINKICLQENFKEQFLISSSDLKKAICNTKNFDKAVSGWRYQLFGQDLKKLIT
jgi:ribonuclease D